MNLGQARDAVGRNHCYAAVSMTDSLVDRTLSAGLFLIF